MGFFRKKNKKEIKDEDAHAASPPKDASPISENPPKLSNSPTKSPVTSATGRRKPALKQRLGDLLVHDGVINEEQLDAALILHRQTGRRIAESLMELGFLNSRTFRRFLAKRGGIAGIDLENYRVSDELIVLFPREYALDHEVFPIDRLGSLLTLAMACPLDTETIREVEKMSSLKVRPILCDLEDVKDCIKKFYPKDSEAEGEKKPDSPE